MSKKRKISDSEKAVAHEEERAKLQREGKSYFFISEYFRIDKDAQNKV